MKHDEIDGDAGIHLRKMNKEREEVKWRKGGKKEKEKELKGSGKKRIRELIKNKRKIKRIGK